MIDHTRTWQLLAATGLVMSLMVGALLPAWAAPLRQDTEPVVLVYGQTVDGQLDGDHPSAFFAFDAQSGDVVTITMIVTEGDLDPFVVLNDPTGVPLATDDNSGGGLNARLTFVIPANGRYTIQATQAGGLFSETGGGFSLNLTAAVDEIQPGGGDETLEPTPESLETPITQMEATRLVPLRGPSTVHDALNRQAAFRIYWFEGRAGDQVSVTPDQFAGFWPLWVLADAGFAELARAEPGTGLRMTLMADGIYFLFASLPDSGNAGGEYGFTFEQASAAVEDIEYPEIVYGQTERGSIDSNTPGVTYRFRGAAGDTVTVSMRRAGGDLNSYLYLLDTNGQLLFEDNDSGGENGDAQMVFTLPADGEYLILATRLGQTQGTTSGSFVLELLSDAPPIPPQEEPTEPVMPTDYAGLPLIAYGDTVEGELNDAKYMDAYVFLGTEGDSIAIEMTSQNKDEVNGLDPLLVLLDDGRIPLIDNDDIVEGQNRDSHIDFILPKTAYYAIVATRFDQDAGTTAGPYQLTLTRAGQEVEDAVTEERPALVDTLAPTPLEAGAPAQGTFDTAAKLYGFSAPAGSLVDLSATTDEGTDAVLILADAELNEVISSAGPLTGITLTRTGEYLVILAPRFGPASSLGGGYILALTQTRVEPTSPEAGPGSASRLAYGDTVNGVIDDDTSSQIYRFDGAAGDRVRILMEATPGSSLDCYLELQAEDGTVIDANDDIDPGVIRDSRITVELPADGTYAIIASRYVGDDAEPTTGAYRLSLEQIVDGAPGESGASGTIPIAYGQSLTGEINDNQYLLFYVFDGVAGDTVTISVDHISGNLDSVLYLYQSVGDGWIQIASNDDSPLGGTYEALLSRIVLPQSGKYLIGVARYGLDQESTAGTFSLTLTREP